MSLHSQDYGNLLGSVISAYSPQAGTAVSSLFQKPVQNVPPPPVSQAIAAPPSKVPQYLMIGGAVLGVVVLGFGLLKLAK